MAAYPEKLHLADVRQRPSYLTVWEKYRRHNVHWLMECIAEAAGVFFYVYAGVGPTAGWVLGNLLQQTGISSILQVGLGYAVGIALAVVIFSPTSGGHFNPAVTIAAAVFRGFPWRKVPRYIISQILGSYIACLIIYVQYKEQITTLEEALLAKGLLGAVNFTSTGPAGIFGLYIPTGSNIGYVLLNEFMVDLFIGITIWACLDPTNVLAPPTAIPWIIGLAYASCIWGYSPVGISANTARDLGGRLMVLTIWGSKAAGGSYAALAALTNIPATLFAAMFYEFFLVDSSRVVTNAHREHMENHAAHVEYVDGGISRQSSGSSSHDEKVVVPRLSESSRLSRHA